MGEFIPFDKRQGIVVPWAGDKDELLLNINHAEWVVTEDNELHYLVDGGTEKLKIKDSFLVSVRAAYHTTDWVRLYFEEHYPEIDFDKKFETNKPGVFARIQDEYGYEYEEWSQNKLYERLENELAKSGYKIEWD